MHNIIGNSFFYTNKVTKKNNNNNNITNNNNNSYQIDDTVVARHHLQFVSSIICAIESFQQAKKQERKERSSKRNITNNKHGPMERYRRHGPVAHAGLVESHQDGRRNRRESRGMEAPPQGVFYCLVIETIWFYYQLLSICCKVVSFAYLFLPRLFFVCSLFPSSL